MLDRREIPEMKKRAYKSGTGWCFWRWTEVPSNYILRLHVVKTPWFAICMHWLNSPDPEPWLHDHPVSFLSIILRGSYVEARQHPMRLRYRYRFNFLRATDRHNIVVVEPRTVTLCFMGPKVREWGFHTLQGWEHWKSYNARVYPK